MYAKCVLPGQIRRRKLNKIPVQKVPFGSIVLLIPPLDKTPQSFNVLGQTNGRQIPSHQFSTRMLLLNCKIFFCTANALVIRRRVIWWPSWLKRTLGNTFACKKDMASSSVKGNENRFILEQLKNKKAAKRCQTYWHKTLEERSN